MNRKTNISWIILGLAIPLITGLLIVTITYRVTTNQHYENTSRLIGEICSQNPYLEESVMLALKNVNAGDPKIGSDILKDYGYTPDVFYERNSLSLIAGNLFIWIVAFLLSAGIMYRLKKKNGDRIKGLTDYLYSINNGIASTLLRTEEDEFSHLEDELYKTVVELIQTRETALKERKSLADNLADIAHQLKTPITSMSLMAELLSDSKADSESLLYVENIQKQLVRLEHLVSTLLTLSKLDAGTLELEKQPIDLYDMLSTAVLPLKSLIKQKNQTLSIQSEPLGTYAGDLNWSSEAIINLVKNCYEHTPEGGTIQLCYEQNPVFTQIVVQDNGEGFAKEDIPHLFERFYKGKNSRKESVGIGLALAKAVIEKQNGSIRAENKPEGGARFIIKFYTN